MFGLDEHIAALGAGEVFAVVALIAVLLGLRHATDPDHVTAVTTLVAGEEPSARGARRLGLSWGLGHATTLLAFGVPVVVARSYLPDPVQRAAEAAVGVMIVVLAVRLLHRWRRGLLHGREGSAAAGRSPLQAYGIGLVHGIGGSAGVGVLLLAAIPDHVEGVVALAVFALFTAVSMALASSSFGWVLSRGTVRRAYGALAPGLAVASLAFGTWYALGAVAAVPYVL
jgi:high-affinity nickel permease